MRWFAKSNKKKVWANTYGRKILARRALRRIVALSIAEEGASRLSAIAASASTDAIDGLSGRSKPVAMANCLIDTLKATNAALNGGKLQ